jgi:hypothetical protein
MNPEQLHDAISLLPEDLLEPVDQLRQKKRIPWKSVAVLAACMCLVLGLWSLFPDDMKSADNAGRLPDKGFSNISDSITQESENCTTLVATVLEVAQDHITVLPGEQLTDIAKPDTVKLTKLETIPPLKKGQRIKLYFDENPYNNQPLVPYRIEIIED